MIKNILTVGDSFTYGEELADRNHAWPFLLADRLSANVTNMARPGSGNKRMIRYIMEHIADKNPLDLVVVGWSSPGRIEFADEDGFFDIWPGYSGNMFLQHQPWRTKLLDYINRHHNDEYLYRQYLLDVILLQSFLKDCSIKYVMCRTLGNEHYHNHNHYANTALSDLVDQTYFPGWPAQGMMEWTFGSQQGPNGHFLDKGHQQVANKIYEHIRHLGWIS
jgi:hypothetical protein